MKITLEHAKKLLETVDAGLSRGLGTPEPGKMCVEAAVTYALGLPFNDRPEVCVLPPAIGMKISLNDRFRGSPAERAQALRRVGLAQLGSAHLSQTDFMQAYALGFVQVILPMVLKDKESKRRCEAATTLDEAKSAAKYAAVSTTGYAEYAASDAASDAAADAAEYAAKYAAEYAAKYAGFAAGYAAESASYASGYAAKYAGFAAGYAAESAGFAAGYAADATGYAAKSASYASGSSAEAAVEAHDGTLRACAELMTQIFISMGSEGSKFLYLTEEAA